MTCNEFKDKVVELFDTQTNPQTATDCEAHMAECAACKAYYEELKAAFDALAPRAGAPEKTLDAAEKALSVTATMPVADEKACHGEARKAVLGGTAEPSGSAAASRRLPVGRHSLLWQAAAAVALFLFGLFVGWNHLFTTPATATPPAPFTFQQGIQCVQNVGSFKMQVMARTTPNENFSYFDPAADFLPIDICLLRQDGQTFFRVAKAGGRTVVCDGQRQYMWTDNGLYVKGSVDTDFLDDFAHFLAPERLLAMQQSAVELSKKTKMERTESDSTIVLTVEGIEKDQNLGLLLAQGRMGECPVVIRNVFSKSDGLLRSVHVWIVWKGRKVEMLRAADIRYNVVLSRTAVTSLPDVAPEAWNDGLAPALQQASRLRMLQRETPEQAARRIMKALCTGQTTSAEEALATYKAFLGDLEKAYRGCRATDFVSRKDDGYPGVYVFFTLTTPDGTMRKEHIALRNDNKQRIWMADGGL